MELERGLTNRHVQLIAIGGAIGTGLFLGSGKTIELAGPSILLAYLIIGIFILIVMRALGELLLSDLDKHSFVDFANVYLGRRIAFITGWTYWFCWIAVAMTDLTAVGIYIRYWAPGVPQWLPALVCLVILVFLNLLSVKLFGEIEFWISMIKIVAIIALIVIGVYMIATKFETASGTTSLKNIYSHGGFFPTGVKGFMLGLQASVFAFAGVELVGLTAAETDNPLKVIPSAINSIPIRILLFYLGSLTVIMSIQPWDTIVASESPFVTVFATVGIAGAASIVNFVVLSSAISACNSAVFSTSRMLYGLSESENAPKSFSKLSSKKIPAVALYSSALVITTTVILNYIMPEGVFLLITSIATSCFIVIWGVIVVCHMKFVKQTKKRPNFKLPFTPYLNWLTILFFIMIACLLGVLPESRVALFVSPVWFIFLNIMYSLFYKKSEPPKE
ncbi:amino acid permease [Vagococcus coleopterorum]|uniref:Amino acid permease n=1 Tax=Vagococcus coleopterorum TaxID=2714946 RepID=A0A6G8AP39_9ENTE|nr:amino acid permease [Vagococcus coleopterorum]QIL46757.1 amino acid permease [Vagococcus coleopterorum]